MESRNVLLINGPNLDLLGRREPAVYGTATLEDCVTVARDAAAAHGLTLDAVQSNHEGVLVEAVHEALDRYSGIVINAGAFTHSSWALHDALAAYSGPVVEVHLSNIDAREPWRRTSVVSPVANGTISGFGPIGYRLALDALADLLERSAR